MTALYLLAAVVAGAILGAVLFAVLVVGFLVVSIHLDKRAKAKRRCECCPPLPVRDVSDFAKWEREVAA